jgi:hypothetical protein
MFIERRVASSGCPPPSTEQGADAGALTSEGAEATPPQLRAAAVPSVARKSRCARTPCWGTTCKQRQCRARGARGRNASAATRISHLHVCFAARYQPEARPRAVVLVDLRTGRLRSDASHKSMVPPHDTVMAPGRQAGGHALHARTHPMAHVRAVVLAERVAGAIGGRRLAVTADAPGKEERLRAVAGRARHWVERRLVYI